jgi:predicted amidohydrolase
MPMNSTRKYEESLAVGVVQTTIDAAQAWLPEADAPKMSEVEDDHVWMEICKAMRAFLDDGLKPRMVIFPELSLPRTRLNEFEHLVGALNIIAFTGVDYLLDYETKTARNQGIVFIPRGFFRDYPSRYCTRLVFGKTYPSPKEERKLKNLIYPWSFRGDQNVYIFDCACYGRVGVSICYDFMDIERALMFRHQIEHLFILAYNQDLGMFKSLADALSRTIYCNVVVCNTGYFGGSLAVSPYYEAYNRSLYAHDGRNLFTTQVVKLPVRDLINARNGEMPVTKIDKPATEIQKFKDPPPGLPASDYFPL